MEEKNQKQIQNEKNTASDIAYFYNSYGKKELEKMIEKEKDYIAYEVKDMDDLMFSRGTINGIKSVLDWLQSQSLFAIEADDE